jgi:RES domain-containing protein
MRVIRRGGRYLRVADPDWDDPLDGSYSARFGGRWNPPDSFPVCYLSCDLPTARANARQLLERRLLGLPFTVDDIDPDEFPVLVGTDVHEDECVDIVSDEGCEAAGLPRTYPKDEQGETVTWHHCQPIGSAAWAEGRTAIACRSAAECAPRDGEEMAWFQRDRRLHVIERRPFHDWYGEVDWPDTMRDQL